MADFFEEIKRRLKKERTKTIVFPEATDERILTAASKLANERIIQSLLIGNSAHIVRKANKFRIDISNCFLLDPEEYKYKDEMIDTLLRKRRGKLTEKEAMEKVRDANYFATLLVAMEKADGLVTGAVYQTKDAIRPALELIQMKAGVQKVSSCFLMIRESEIFFFADCALQIAPSSEELAEIALETAKTARLFQVEPKVALLSFSTKGSADSVETKKVRDALHIFQHKNADVFVDGELQFDTASVPEIAARKAPTSLIRGNATVFVFPNLEAGNIGYKIAEHLGGFQAIGPILQGLKYPINDLSRGATMEDIYHLALITALQGSEMTS